MYMHTTSVHVCVREWVCTYISSMCVCECECQQNELKTFAHEYFFKMSSFLCTWRQLRVAHCAQAGRQQKQQPLLAWRRWWHPHLHTYLHTHTHTYLCVCCWACTCMYARVCECMYVNMWNVRLTVCQSIVLLLLFLLLLLLLYV